MYYSLIRSYYGYDEKVIRELLGKKLTQRVRKDLEEVSQKTKVHINGCRRMFDNLKRIQKRVEDLEGPITDVIIQNFLIPRELASRYSNIVSFFL
jgi:TolA-binding protein